MQDQLSLLSLYNVAAQERLFRRIDAFYAVNRLIAARVCITAATVSNPAFCQTANSDWPTDRCQVSPGRRKALGDCCPSHHCSADKPPMGPFPIKKIRRQDRLRATPSTALTRLADDRLRATTFDHSAGGEHVAVKLCCMMRLSGNAVVWFQREGVMPRADRVQRSPCSGPTVSAAP